ncbi:2-oxo acid dehydrogenase acyltransferase (catalytic domain) [Brevibacterium mcbrellneri ATCC 49030]|uniref:Dihydrolipoamide acetyltransferase component of pyruvate dehydrogenase complex n=1 Tax=Brevibacterium mcbrellneri ATCC 49030 TaxID=585530 RepID=D4YL04_9MICO|nr:dihydrolipoamide acetyltransferase family protein [Brevibacterium mcbrellneri]EFG48098.1 2-oxo acid dehydrogenase acyltransferase (catalytic domain) [Brevibacterium mcbrellneri ATCC 49030]
MSNEFNLPDVGEGLTEADVVSWKVGPGDTVTVNQILVEIETAKSLVELPSPQAGTIEAILVEEGETVEVGTPIVRFGGAQGVATPNTAEGAEQNQSAGDEESGPNLVGYGTKASSTKRRPRKGGATPAAATSAKAEPAPAPAQGASATATSAPAETRASTPSKPLAKPPVRKLAKDRGFDLGEVTPTGPNGQITREDVLNHGTTSAQGAAESHAQTAAPVGSGALDGTEERIPFKGVVKFMAQAMVDSAFTAPHVTEFVDVDVTETMNLVRKFKANETLGEGVKVSPLLILSKAVCWAVTRNPRINSALDGDSIVVKKYVNLGIAAATPRGLIVPNIKNAHAMGLSELATELGELTRTARAGKTTPADQAGGTISITNIGVFGIDTGTPIINPGEAAILAFGQIRKRPWVVGDDIVPREITTLGVSADHRVVDGEVISKFLADVARAMEDPTLLLV